MKKEKKDINLKEEKSLLSLGIKNDFKSIIKFDWFYLKLKRNEFQK